MSLDITALLDVCQSPVERLFLSGFLDERAGAENTYGEETLFDLGLSECGRLLVWEDDCGDRYAIEPQHVCGHTFGSRITVDFCIWTPSRFAILAVEIDGHDWHERNKAQAQRDKSRDRELIRRGVRVARFTGSEVWAEPWRCAREAADLARSIYWDLNHVEANYMELLIERGLLAPRGARTR